MFSVVFTSISTNVTSFESSSEVHSKYAINPCLGHLGCTASILKDRSRGMAEKPHSRYSSWKPSQPEATSTYSYLSNSPTVASLLIGNLHFPRSQAIIINLGTRLVRLGSSAAHSHHMHRKCVQPPLMHTICYTQWLGALAT